ncbi:MAG: zf-HC2 domain-containing protein [Oscillospiraceae bacterium]|nr:zf-HC2 domain-containing protein [Oscillospiraceae bacterium]
MNGCNEFRELISCRLDGELDAADVSSLEKHLEGCPSCRSYYELLSAVLGAETKVEPPPALLAGVMEGIKTAPRPKRNVLRPVITVAAAAACLAIVIAAVGVPKFTERNDAVSAGGAAPSQYNLGASAPLRTTSPENTYPVSAASDEIAEDSDVSYNMIAESAPEPEPAPEPPALKSAPAAAEEAPQEDSVPLPPVGFDGGSKPADASASAGSTAPAASSSNDTRAAGGGAAPDTRTPEMPAEDMPESPAALPVPEDEVDEEKALFISPTGGYRAIVHIRGELPEELLDYDLIELDDGRFEIFAPAELLPALESAGCEVDYQDEESDVIYIVYKPE